MIPRSAPGDLGIDVKLDHVGNTLESLPDARRHHRTSTKRENQPMLFRLAQNTLSRLPLQPAKSLFSLFPENPINRFARGFLQRVVAVDETPTQPFRHQPANRGLSGTHEPGERYDRYCRRHNPLSSSPSSYDCTLASTSCMESPPNFIR